MNETRWSSAAAEASVERRRDELHSRPLGDLIPWQAQIDELQRQNLDLRRLVAELLHKNQLLRDAMGAVSD